jgi:hypothetical protein
MSIGTTNTKNAKAPAARKKCRIPKPYYPAIVPVAATNNPPFGVRKGLNCCHTGLAVKYPILGKGDYPEVSILY